MNIYHEKQGLVFQKIQADSGISYLSVEPETIDDASGLLVRHGTPDKKCGYYPVTLLFEERTVRRKVASRLSKRPPNETWVSRMRRLLEEQGLQPIH